MRLHELAVMSWLNGWATVREGYPVPVVFTSPLDAFSHFKNLWADANNPFAYLLALKDDKGTPLYQPHPAPVRYPVISVHRKGWKYRVGQNYSIHRWRHINWPTVSDTGDPIPGKPQIGTNLLRPQLGDVTTARRPMAFDFRFQVDHFCNRPDTQAFFVEQLVQQMWRTGSTPQTWIPIPYPAYGQMLIRLYLDGDIDNMTPEEPAEGSNVEFHTSFSIVVEGYFVDLDFRVYPALWQIVAADMDETDPTHLRVAFTADGREGDENSVLDSRTNVPADLTTTEWNRLDQTTAYSVDGTSTWQAG